MYPCIFTCWRVILCVFVGVSVTTYCVCVITPFQFIAMVTIVSFPGFSTIIGPVLLSLSSARYTRD